MNARRVEPLAVGAVALAAALVAFTRIHDVALVGWDTFPEIESSRIRNLADALGTFHEQTAEGHFPFAFYRPVFNLSLALDHALWGIGRAGYHASACLLYAACGVALYGLARRLLGGVPGAAAAMALFLLLPVHLEVLPVVSRRMDLLCALFSSLALWTELGRIDRRPLRWGWLPAGFTALAIGSKEIGIVLPPLVFLLALYRTPGQPVGPRIRQAAIAAIPHLGAVAVVLVARLLALDGLGGHPTTRVLGAFDLLPSMFGATLARLSGVVPVVGPVIEARWLWAAGGLGLVAGVASLVPLLRGTAARRPEPVRAAWATAALAFSWIALLSSVYGMSGYMQLWYLLVPGQALALAVGAAVQLLWGPLTSGRGALRQASALGLAAVVAWVGWQALHSPLLRSYQQWERATRKQDAYLSDLETRIRQSPRGARLRVPAPPNLLMADRSPLGASFVTVMSVYSLPAWAALALPDHDVGFRHEMLAERASTVGPDTIVIEVVE